METVLKLQISGDLHATVSRGVRGGLNKSVTFLRKRAGKQKGAGFPAPSQDFIQLVYYHKVRKVKGFMGRVMRYPEAWRSVALFLSRVAELRRGVACNCFKAKELALRVAERNHRSCPPS